MKREKKNSDVTGGLNQVQAGAQSIKGKASDLRRVIGRMLIGINGTN